MIRLLQCPTLKTGGSVFVDGRPGVVRLTDETLDPCAAASKTVPLQKLLGGSVGINSGHTSGDPDS
jgi:hypothetical protein